MTNLVMAWTCGMRKRKMPWIMRIGFRLLAWASGESVLFPRAWNSRVLVSN